MQRKIDLKEVYVVFSLWKKVLDNVTVAWWKSINWKNKENQIYEHIYVIWAHIIIYVERIWLVNIDKNMRYYLMFKHMVL